MDIHASPGEETITGKVLWEGVMGIEYCGVHPRGSWYEDRLRTRMDSGQYNHHKEMHTFD